MSANFFCAIDSKVIISTLGTYWIKYGGGLKMEKLFFNIYFKNPTPLKKIKAGQKLDVRVNLLLYRREY